MKPMSLGYLGLDTADPGAWEVICRDVLGLPSSSMAADGSRRYRLDTCDYRIAVHPSSEPGLRYAGWELQDMRELETLSKRLSDAGHDWTAGSRDLAVRRGVAALIEFDDPSGFRFEAFVGARYDRTSTFVSPLGYRYVTENLGLGHIACTSGNYAETLAFYQDVLGMGVSDFLAGDFSVAFVGSCPRHHSIAIVDAGDGPSRLDHLMLELTELADVGRAYDRCIDGSAPVTFTLGKHWNDQTTSFYFQTPSAIDIELGWGGRTVDRATHVATQGDGEISMWGHRPLTETAARRFGRTTWLTMLNNAERAGLY